MKHKKICAALMAAMIGIGTMAASPASEAASREEKQTGYELQILEQGRSLL